jgi:hypothetical protein
MDQNQNGVESSITLHPAAQMEVAGTGISPISNQAQ